MSFWKTCARIIFGQLNAGWYEGRWRWIGALLIAMLLQRNTHAHTASALAHQQTQTLRHTCHTHTHIHAHLILFNDRKIHACLLAAATHNTTSITFNAGAQRNQRANERTNERPMSISKPTHSPPPASSATPPSPIAKRNQPHALRV